MDTLGKKKFEPLKYTKYVFLVLYTIVIIFPLIFVFISSMKSNTEIFMTPWSMPENFNLNVYKEIWTMFDVGLYFKNSLYYAIVSVLLSVMISAMASYALTRMKWKLKTAVFSLIMLGIMVPVHSEIVPLYIIFRRLGFNDARLSLVGIYVAFAIPITVFILSGFIKGLPIELEESAVIEGSGLIGAFFKIILPLLKSALATVTIFNFLSVWNDYFSALIFVSKETDKTLQLGITRFQGSFTTRYSYLLAAVMIAIIPSIVVYSIMQDKIVSGLTAGAVKG